nr:MAG TPA: H-type lectin domain [Caudoviricetes sp.]
MLTNGGEYNPETAYEQLTMVMYENSTYITLKTVQGITPTDDHINYQLMAKGFNPTALESVQAEDTSGVLGEVGGTVSAQDLINWVVDQAATKLLKISDLVSVQTNDATKGVSAALAYAMGQKLDQLNSNLTVLNAKEIQFKLAVKPVFTSTNDLASGDEVMFTVTFDKAFSVIPALTFTLRTNGDLFLSQVDSISTTGFTGYIRNPFPSAKPVRNVSLCYIAMC